MLLTQEAARIAWFDVITLMFCMAHSIASDCAFCLPACMQDTARNFLCGSVADKKKYEIFMKVCGPWLGY
jgi:hypothetical protein